MMEIRNERNSIQKSTICESTLGFCHILKKCMFKASMDLKIRLRFFKTYIWSIPFYRCETWTVRPFSD